METNFAHLSNDDFELTPDDKLDEMIIEGIQNKFSSQITHIVECINIEYGLPLGETSPAQSEGIQTLISQLSRLIYRSHFR